MKCSNCGNKLSAENKFCPFCGNEVKNKEFPEKAVWGIGIIIILGIGIFTYYQLNKDNVYDEAMEDATDALLVGDYEQAGNHFEVALDEKPEDESIRNLYTQTELHNEALLFFEEGEVSRALELAEGIQGLDETSEASLVLMEQVNELVAELEEVEATQQMEADTFYGYPANEVEYARMIEMVGYPASPTVYISMHPAGRAVASGYEETIKFAEETIRISGEITADGSITYASNGDGTVTIYPMPSHWHQEDQSPAGYREYAQEILDGAQRVDLDYGNEQDILNKLENTEFIYIE